MSKKAIVLVSGPLGVGKTSLCRMISNKLGYHFVDGDSFFVPLEKSDLSWEERLRRSWKWITDQTKKHVDNGENIVIDFVVEDELDWFLKQASDLDVQIKYVVLVSSEDEIKKRLVKRDGGLQYFDRSKKLLSKLRTDPRNSKHLYDTTGKRTKEVFNEVIGDDTLLIK